jgi:hypothetical protein
MTLPASTAGSQRSTIRSASSAQCRMFRSASSAQCPMIRSASSANGGRGLPNRTSGERDASQPQVRDQTEPSFVNVTNTVNSGEAERQ